MNTYVGHGSTYRVTHLKTDPFDPRLLWRTVNPCTLQQTLGLVKLESIGSIYSEFVVDLLCDNFKTNPQQIDPVDFKSTPRWSTLCHLNYCQKFLFRRRESDVLLCNHAAALILSRHVD